MTTETPQPWRTGDWMQTFTGKRFYPLAPRAEDVDPFDIAHALGNLCRFNGHVRRFYSVAEHCVLMADWATRNGLGRDIALWALLHDATEAYVGDMIRPLKRFMPDYERAEAGVMFAIAERFGLPREDIMSVDLPSMVKHADNRILLTERRELLPDTGAGAWGVDDLAPLDVQIRTWGPRQATDVYLATLEQLGAFQ